MKASESMKKYFEELEKNTKLIYDIASLARSKNLDPMDKVEITLAKNMAERVVGLISVVAPQIKGSGVVERIIELENKYGVLDWRVALVIAKEIALETFCKFKDQKEAIEVGIRTGFAYVTVGVVSSPLEGLTNINLKNRNDGQGQYFSLNFSGPIRNAGGTAAAVSVIIADYVRRQLGFAKFDPTEDEVKRTYTEVMDYHERITNLQYVPSKDEIEFLFKNVPVEVTGDGNEKIEVSNYKDIPRIPTNRLRSGFCLIYSSCIPLKAPKLWKQLSKWGKDMDLDQWDFLEDFLKIQKKAKSGKSSKSSDSSEKKEKITPIYTYIADLVGGRPIIGHPLAKGGFRLRYGRSRASGYSGQSIHPATMHVLNDFIAIGTQLKVERPGKAAAFTPCNIIDGPIVKLKDDSVIRLETEQLAKQYKKEIKEVLFLGDVLINYGDFYDRAHSLVPSGYCEEWYILELEKAIVDTFGLFDIDKVLELVDIDKKNIENLFQNPFKNKITLKESLSLSQKLNIPLHPYHTFHWKDISKDDFKLIIDSLKIAKIYPNHDKIIFKLDAKLKRALELIGLPHIVATNEYIVVDDFAEALITNIDFYSKNIDYLDDNLETINKYNSVIIRDKSGTYIGARMGRPEKAKMRHMKGSPHGLFPIGEEGGRLRSFQSALKVGEVTGDFPTFKCKQCNKETIYPSCEICGSKTKRLYICNQCGLVDKLECHGPTEPSSNRKIDLKYYFNVALNKLKTKTYPDLIKGVRGTANKEHIPENLIKAILRAKHNIYVNKDGTIRYDASEIALTHFKPNEIAVSPSKLKELGYLFDVYGKPLINGDQILELKPQDVVIPCCPVSPEEPCDDVLFRVANYIDELLVKLYDLKPYYKLKNKADLVGHYIIGLAPHTSAGSLGRIIGFSKSQGFLAHPMYHAAMRRDCDGDESCFLLLMDSFLNFSTKFLPNHRGSTMDAPLVLTSILTPGEVDDMAFNVDIVDHYPLELYQAALEYKKPWEINIKKINDVLNTPQQYEGMMFTHDNGDINAGVLCSAYKTLPSMQEKLDGQLDIAEKVRAVDERDVARLVIEKHFIRDTKGNLRKFTMQKFRCVACNESFRRPPLVGKCIKCGGKIIFTIAEGSVIKYFQPSMNLAMKYNVSPYLKQTLKILERRIEGVFGKEKEKQSGLNSFF